MMHAVTRIISSTMSMGRPSRAIEPQRRAVASASASITG